MAATLQPWQQEFEPGDNRSSAGTSPDDLQGSEGQAPPQPQLDELDYTIKLDQEAMQRLGRRIKHEIRRSLEASSPRRFNLIKWRADFEVARTGASNRWIGAADVPSLLTRIYCSAAATRLSSQITGAKPPMSVVARTQEAIDAAPYIEDALTYVLEQADWTKCADEAHQELAIAGNVFLRISYEEEYRRVPVLQVEHDEDETMARAQMGADGVNAMFDGLETDEQGKVKTYLGWEDRLKYRGVRMKVIPWQDGIICPPTVRDSTDAYGIGEICYIRGDQLKAGAKIGRYIPEQAEKLLRSHSDNPNTSDDGYNTRYERQLDQGILPDGASEFVGDREEDALYREYQCYDLCWKGDWDDDGVLEWAWVTIHYPTGTIIRLQYLPYEHGEACYVMIPFLPRVNELYGAGMAEMIAVYQDADTALMCQYIDHNDLALAMNGNYFYQKSAGLKPDRQVLQLGVPIPVDDIAGVKQIEFNPLPQEAYTVGKIIKERLDLATANSNPGLGQVTDEKRTLGEVQIVAAAGNMMFEEMGARVARHWQRVWDQIRWLVAQYGDGSGDPGTVTYRKAAIPGRKITVTNPQTGEQQQMPVALVGGQEVPAPQGAVFTPIDADLLRQDVDLVPTGLQLMADMQSRLGQARSVMDLVMQHPLTQGNVEVQKIALDVFLQAFHYPQMEKMMAAIEQGIVAQQQAAAQQQAMAQQQTDAQSLAALAMHHAAPMPGQANGGGQPAVAGRMAQATAQAIGPNGGGGP